MGIREIANKAGVSIATVSRVLNTPYLVKSATRDAVLEIAQELNYKKYNTTQLLLNDNDEIGVIIPNVVNQFFARIYEGIAKQAQILGFPVTLYLTHDEFKNEVAAVDKLIEKNISGIILIRVRNKEQESMKTIAKLSQRKIPFILVDRDISDSDYSGIFLSNANAVYDAVNMILDDGYSKIDFITGPKNDLNSKQRLNGYKKSIKKHKLTIEKDSIYYSDFTMESGFDITTKILKKKTLPEFIFSCTNRLTIGCIKAIQQAGLTLGKDIKIFSFNQVNISYINTFNISYIEHPVELMGEKSVLALKNKIVGTKGVIREIINYKINY